MNKFKKPMATPPTSEPRASPVTEEAIRERAYELHQERGRQDGQAIEDWLTAEAELMDTKKQGRSELVGLHANESKHAASVRILQGTEAARNSRRTI